LHQHVLQTTGTATHPWKASGSAAEVEILFVFALVAVGVAVPVVPSSLRSFLLSLALAGSLDFGSTTSDGFEFLGTNEIVHFICLEEIERNISNSYFFLVQISLLHSPGLQLRHFSGNKLKHTFDVSIKVDAL
jgi:hypothetical protein